MIMNVHYAFEIIMIATWAAITDPGSSSQTLIEHMKLH